MTKILSFLIFLLLAVGIIALLNIHFENFLDLFKGKKKEKTLGDLISVYNPKAKKEKKGFKKTTAEIKEILELTGQEDKFNKVKMATVFFAVAGFLICGFAYNWIMAPVAMAITAVIPYVCIKRVCNRYEKAIDESIEATLSIITNSYLRTENIVTAVKENLSYIQDPLKGHFEHFVAEVETVNPNVAIALNNLKYKVGNPVFFDWCNRLIQCQSDRNLKHTLLPIIERMSDLRALRAELAAQLVGPRNEAITMALLVFGNFPLLWFINKDWFAILTDTIQGKIATAVIVLIVFVCFIFIWKLCQPLKYEDLEGR